jgi:hypothetical protein
LRRRRNPSQWTDAAPLAFEANDTAGVDTVRTAVQRPAREVREIVAGAVPMR